MTPPPESRLLDRDRSHVWHPYTQMRTAPQPLAIVRGQGVYLYTEDGRRIFNPGSPTDRRRQPRGTVGVLDVRDGQLVSAQVIPVTPAP